MSKTMGLITIIFYDIIISAVAGSMGFATSGNAVIEVGENVGFTLSFLYNTITAFANLITFNVVGLPTFFTVIFIYLPNITLFIILIKLIFNRD